jgi:RNA polymerase sigma-70 factor (ECF subfamily)
MDPSHSPVGFPTTCWSRVARAGDPQASEARSALAELCATYWYPIYAFVRRRGWNSDAALDLTQEYFARLLEAPVLAAADRSKGRFRAFLRADCSFFLAHVREHDATRKRGGGSAPLSIDARDAEGRYVREPMDESLTPDRVFDRAWAVGLLESVLDHLAVDQAGARQVERFDVLRPTLEGDRSVPSTVLAARLGMTEAAVLTAVSRLRKRYRVILREQIAATLDDPTEAAIDAEITDLFTALGA